MSDDSQKTVSFYGFVIDTNELGTDYEVDKVERNHHKRN